MKILNPKSKKEIWYLKDLKTGEELINKYVVLINSVSDKLSQGYNVEDLEFRVATDNEKEIYRNA